MQKTAMTQQQTDSHNLTTLLQKAIASHQQGLLEQAASIYKQILLLSPEHPDALHLLGVAYHQRNQNELAVDLISKAILIHPTALMFSNLGVANQALGREEQAIKCYQDAIDTDPNFSDAYNNLGIVLLNQGKHDASINCFSKSIKLNPSQHSAHINLGNAYRSLGKLDFAISSYENALLINSSSPDAHNNLGVALHSQGQFDEALVHYEMTIKLRPDDSGAWNNLGSTLLAKSNLSRATECYKRSIALNPSNVEALSNLGLSLLRQGMLDESISYLRKAISINPKFNGAHWNLIYVLDMHPEIKDISLLQGERRAWAAINASQTLKLPHKTELRAKKKLKIGYVSADFRRHSAASCFSAMLIHYDRENFEVYAYSNSNLEDYCTYELKKSVTCWRSIYGMSDTDAAHLIRDDLIDILVDLSAFTEGNRLTLFSLKPAPFQITAWGYVGGTGMNEMDVLFADSILIPEDEKVFYSEEIRYLPSPITLHLFEASPPHSFIPPIDTNQVITFGSFNRLVKVNTNTLELWCKVLHEVRGSKLVLKTPELDDPSTCERILNFFDTHTIDPQRIKLIGRTSWLHHMQAFNQIDICLDPFPHGGGVTTLESLIMGVPVISLCYPTLVGRLSASLLTHAGLTNWIANSEDEYIQKAISYSNANVELSRLRRELPGIILGSYLGNEKIYVAAVEKEYIYLWDRLCKNCTYLG